MEVEHNKKKVEVISIKNAIEDFFNSKISLYYKPQNSTKREKITPVLYREVIFKFFRIYIYQLIFGKDILYFPFGGKATIVRCGKWIKKDLSNREVAKKNILKKTDHSLGVFWYDRPFIRYFYFKLRKMTGSSNHFPLIEAEYKKSNDISILETTKMMKEKYHIYYFKK